MRNDTMKMLGILKRIWLDLLSLAFLAYCVKLMLSISTNPTESKYLLFSGITGGLVLGNLFWKLTPQATQAGVSPTLTPEKARFKAIVMIVLVLIAVIWVAWLIVNGGK